MFRKLPILLIVMIALLLVLDPYLSYEAKSFLYALSLSIKTVIITLLPLVIFGLLFKAMSQLSNKATKIILFILGGVCCSNFLSTFLSHYVGIWVFHFDLSVMKPQSSNELNPLFVLSLPKLISNDKAMAAGLVLGIVLPFFSAKWAAICANAFDKVIEKILKAITFLIPFFVAGFIVKLNYDGSIKKLMQDYALIFLVIGISQFSYILFVYCLSQRFRLAQFLKSIQNMFPATLAGFSTMSSAAAMPLTIMATEKNAQNKDLSRSVIPATVNIHLMGDCFAIPILAYAILKSFNFPEPLFLDYLIFTFYFVLAKFSVAGVPGGGIIVMLPVLEKYLGFNSEMLSLITALYILFDPVITSANVLGNGGFAILIDKFANWKRISKT